MTITERHNPLAPQIDAINSDIAAIETEIMIVRNSAESVLKRMRIADLEARQVSLFTRKRQLIANAKASR
jgi:hypothetical protein